MNNRNDPNPSPEESAEERKDFDENANDLWSLYGKESKSHDEAQIATLKGDMDGVLIFVCAIFFSRLASVNISLIPGRFILCCSRRVRRAKDPRYES